MNNVLTRFTAVLILGVTWVIAWQQILYAKDLPGDGFTAGVFMLVAVLLVFVVIGYRQASILLPPEVFLKSTFIGLALIIALFLVPLVWGGDPLEPFPIPLGPFQVSSTILFEIGIFFSIGGSLIVSLTSLGRDTQ